MNAPQIRVKKTIFASTAGAATSGCYNQVRICMDIQISTYGNCFGGILKMTFKVTAIQACLWIPDVSWQSVYKRKTDVCQIVWVTQPIILICAMFSLYYVLLISFTKEPTTCSENNGGCEDQCEETNTVSRLLAPAPFQG